MERRSFLRAMLGVAAATALPSEVWPFRKIFLPPKRYWAGTLVEIPFFPNLDGLTYLHYTTGHFYPELYGDFNSRTAASVFAHQRETERKVNRVLERFLS